MQERMVCSSLQVRRKQWRVYERRRADPALEPAVLVPAEGEVAAPRHRHSVLRCAAVIARQNQD
eukprot:SAG11_NODE_10736_length_809_cov_0.861972_1_plen_63_part_10